MDQPRDEQNRDDLAPEEGVIGAIPGPSEGADEEAGAPAEERPARRRRPWVLGCLLALLGVLLGAAVALVAGRGCGPVAPEGPVIALPRPGSPDTRLVFSAGPEEPATTPEIIPAETSVVFCFYRLNRVPPDAALTAKWWHDGEELGALELRDQRPDGDAEYAAGRFTIYPPTPPTRAAPGAEPPPAEPPASSSAGATGTAGSIAVFPPGIYEVELTSPAQPDVVARGSFVALPRAAKILQGGGEPAGPPMVRALTTATGVAEDGTALGPATVFPRDVRRIYAVFEYAGIAPGAVLTVRWFIEGTELERARAEIPVAAERGSAHAWLEVGTSDRLPDAQYQVRVYLGEEDHALASSGFRISASAPPIAPGNAGPVG